MQYDLKTLVPSIVVIIGLICKSINIDFVSDAQIESFVNGVLALASFIAIFVNHKKPIQKEQETETNQVGTPLAYVPAEDVEQFKKTTQQISKTTAADNGV